MVNSRFFYLFPFLSALAGWIIAKGAVSVYTSIIIKQKQKIGNLVGSYAEQQISLDAIEQKLMEPAAVEKILPFADQQIEQFLRVKLPAAMPMLAMFISDKLVADMKGIFMTELKELFPSLILQYTGNLKKDISIGKLVSSRLAAIPTSTLRDVLGKQLRIVEISCGATGFMCGCLYILLTWIA